MPVTLLEGDTLGNKRRHYNKLVEDAIANKQYELSGISADDSDIDNLLKIDIACRNRNVDYIIEVMKSKDMLYAATAIKKSTWLITEQQYANIINPEYLHTQLLPSMNTKTFNKLMLQIRLNLKDESRVETFYEYLKQTDNSYKWLQNCSIPFIEKVMKNERLIPLSLFKRLCRRSVRFLTLYMRVELDSLCYVKREILFLLKSHTTEVLKVVEDVGYDYYPDIGKKKTKFLMKTCPERILNKIDRYCHSIDMTIIPQYLKQKEIKAFLYKHAKNGMHFLCHYDLLKHFINNMPREERFEFVRKTFIDKTELAAFYPEYERDNMNRHIKSYQWYEFAQFNVAFKELKKLIRKETLPSQRIAMLSILITSAKRNPEHIKSLLKFVKDKHINEPIKFKIQFVNNFLLEISTHDFDVEAWTLLDQLFYSMEVYTKSDNNVQLCIESVTTYKVLHDEPVPEIIKQKMTFNSFKKLKKLNGEQHDKMITYLLHFVLIKVQSKIIANESDFSEAVIQLKNALTLIKDWKKNISTYLNVLKKIQELIKIKQENIWKTDMSCLYNVKKSWRKSMFEESLSLCLSEEACLNALKHKPQLLMRHDKEIDTLRTNDAISLRRLLAKLRVYWPHSLARHWTNAYLQNLNNPTGQGASVRGLFMLLSQNQIIDMATKYVPEDFKISWGETDQTVIGIRKNIAQNLHIARPLITLDKILWYAKGDYLQHAVPSLNAILSNLSEIESQEHVPLLLGAPVSLQKFGIHLVFNKLKYDDQKSVFSKILSSTKNLTIRSVLFKHTYTQICKVKDPAIENNLWELLSSFMDNLSSEENTSIYNLLGSVKKLPIGVRAKYYMKSYSFLTSLPASSNCEKCIKSLIQYAPEIMESLDEQFVADILLSPIGPKFCSMRSKFMKVFACYVLCGKSEEDQLQRFKKVIDPAMEEASQMWDCVHYSDCYYVRENFNEFLEALVWHFRKFYVTLKIIPIPARLFLEIQTKIEKVICLSNNYIMYTSWKLTAEYFRLMKEFSFSVNPFESSNFPESHFEEMWMSREIESIWKNIHTKISPSLGSIIVKRLKEDIEQYNCPTIYCPFADAFEEMFKKLCFQDVGFELETLEHMLSDCDFIPSYLVVAKTTSKYCASEFNSQRSQIRKKLETHPSTTVRLHYYSRFHDIPKD